jgi:hypothetical protein
MLLDENANPKLYTNDGQSSEDLAYDGGFTIVSFSSLSGWMLYFNSMNIIYSMKSM